MRRAAMGLLLFASMMVAALVPAAQAAAEKPELENAWVRVWRSTLAPHEKQPARQHLPTVLVT